MYIYIFFYIYAYKYVYICIYINSPTYPPKSLTYPHKRHIYHPPKEPYISTKRALHIRKRDLYFKKIASHIRNSAISITPYDLHMSALHHLHAKSPLHLSSAPIIYYTCSYLLYLLIIRFHKHTHHLHTFSTPNISPTHIIRFHKHTLSHITPAHILYASYNIYTHHTS